MRENLVNDSSILCVWYSLSLVTFLLNAYNSNVRHLLLWENTDPKQFLEEKVYLVYKLQSIVREAKAGTQDRNVEGGAETKPWMGLHQQSIKTPHRHGHRQSDRGIFQLRVCFQIILTCIMKTKQTNKMTSAAQFAQINCIYIMGSLKLFYRFIYEYSYESCIHPNLW